MNNAGFANWMLLAVVVGLGQLSYWLYKNYGFGVPLKVSLAATAVAALVCLGIYLTRLARKMR